MAKAQLPVSPGYSVSVLEQWRTTEYESEHWLRFGAARKQTLCLLNESWRSDLY
jgi:hypothetical protein